MDNPFDGIDVKKTERKQLPEDVYFAQLKEVSVVDAKDKEGKPTKKIKFSFYIPEHEHSLSSFFYRSVAESSHLIKFLKKILGEALTDEIRLDTDRLWALVKKLIGRDFKLMVSCYKEYNNIDSAILVKDKAQPKPAPKPTPKVEQEDLSFSDDDIPF